MTAAKKGKKSAKQLRRKRKGGRQRRYIVLFFVAGLGLMLVTRLGLNQKTALLTREYQSTFQAISESEANIQKLELSITELKDLDNINEALQGQFSEDPADIHFPSSD